MARLSRRAARPGLRRKRRRSQLLRSPVRSSSGVERGDRYAKTHGGVWDLFFRLFVDSGRFERGLYAEARQIERVRLDAHYEAREVPLEMAGQVVETAVRFVAAVERMLSE